MSAWNSIVIIAGIAVFAWLCRREADRANRARLALRLVVSFAAVVCMTCAALDLKYTQSTAGGNELIVVTDGAGKESVRAFQQQKRNTPEIMEKELALASHRVYDTVHVLGYGMRTAELKSLPARNIRFHPAAIQTGITSVTWNRRVNKGERLLLQGKLANTSGKACMIRLMAFGTTLDSMVAPAGRSSFFQLAAIPKQNGRALYHLCVTQGADTLEKEPVPVDVQSPDPIRLLILSGAPDFENRFLKDWLSQLGYPVAVRTWISAGKHDRSAANTGQRAVERLTPQALDSFDIVVSDEIALSHVAAVELDAIHKSVALKGMGLILRGDTIASQREWYTQPFHLYTTDEKLKRLSLSAADRLREPFLPLASQPRFIRPAYGIQALVTDSASRMVAAMVAEGRGRILFSTLNNTYSWLLSGNAADYYALWSSLLAKAGRRHVEDMGIKMATRLPFVNQPATVQREAGNDTIPVTYPENEVSFAQNLQNPLQWQSTIWPVAPGWQGLGAGKDSSGWYVYDVRDWRYVRSAENIRATQEYIRGATDRVVTFTEGSVLDHRPIPLFWFFLPFIICCAFLWAERKIS